MYTDPRQSSTADCRTVFLPDSAEHFTKAVSFCDVVRSSVNTKTIRVLIFFKLLLIDIVVNIIRNRIRRKYARRNSITCWPNSTGCFGGCWTVAHHRLRSIRKLIAPRNRPLDRQVRVPAYVRPADRRAAASTG